MDGDTSTNDTVIGLASGAAGNAVIADGSSADAKALSGALTALLQVRYCAICIMDAKRTTKQSAKRTTDSKQGRVTRQRCSVGV